MTYSWLRKAITQAAPGISMEEGKAKALQALNDLFAKRFGKDIVMIAFNGDTPLDTSTRTNKALRVLDGFIKQAQADGDVHDYTIPGSPSYNSQVFPGMLQALPKHYKDGDREDLVFFVSADVYDAYAIEIGSRATAMAQEHRGEEASQRVQRHRRAKEEARRLEERLLRVDERYVDGDLERDSYARLKEKYAGELTRVRMVVAGEAATSATRAAHLGFAIDVMGRLVELRVASGPEMRNEMIGSIWPAGLEIADGSCRTPEPSEIIALFRGETQKIKNAAPKKDAASYEVHSTERYLNQRYSLALGGL